MEKAYDLKALGEKLKNAGVPLLKDSAELTAKAVYEATKEWYVESALLSPNKIDDATVPFVAMVDKVVMPQIDKINGKEDL